MNRPEALNALNGELIDAMSDALRDGRGRRARPRVIVCAAPAARSAPATT